MATTTYGIYSSNRRQVSQVRHGANNRIAGGAKPIAKAKPPGFSSGLGKRGKSR